ncbi:M23 family metallopeptidase [Candidatus Gottesmanbacteria bacterium]|nr:M23 family metallopeptidase [Candidatus Gottesmanbacteria bacterium]
MSYMFFQDLSDWRRGWFFYGERKLEIAASHFEQYKTVIVDLLMARRGGYQRPFLLFSLGMLLVTGFLSAPILARSYPGAIPSRLSEFTPASAVLTSLDLAEYGVQTQVSAKPRDQVLTYLVAAGDTLASISQKFDVSIDSITWASDLKGDSLSVGQELKIPPVTGIVHKVREGETVYTIAKKYRTEAQKIVNFPFNDFTDLDTFALVAGQMLIVPDGVQPQAAPIVVPQAPVFVGGTGQFQWPVGGIITQYPVWYHMAVDIANPAAPGIAAAEAGVISLVEYLRWGYGHHILVDHGGGFATLYAHLSEIYVKPGDRVSRGQVIGRMGVTGRSTGMHLHFEVRRNGVIVNPLPFLK